MPKRTHTDVSDYIDDSIAHIGHRLRDERHRLNLSLQNAEHTTGTALGTISRYELGKSEPSLRYIVGLQIHGGDSVYALTGKRYDLPPFTISDSTPPVLSREDIYSLMAEHPAAADLRLNFCNLQLTVEYMYQQRLDIHGFCKLVALLTAIVKESIGSTGRYPHPCDLDEL